eukprot:3348566-Prymnesium_polylepis.1
MSRVADRVMRYTLAGGLRYALQACVAAALRVAPRRQCNAVRGRAPWIGRALLESVTYLEIRKGTTPSLHPIAISLKGGELREVGLANLASRLAARVPQSSIRKVPPTLQRSRSKWLSKMGKRGWSVELANANMGSERVCSVHLGTVHPGATRSTKSWMSAARPSRKSSFTAAVEQVGEANPENDGAIPASSAALTVESS